jgi:hypothetical protein
VETTNRKGGKNSMTINFTHHEGSQAEEPLAIDTESSKDIVYLRRNIEQIERKDEQTGETVTLWGYEEAQLTREEYETYSVIIEETKKIKNEMQSQIDYLAIMTDTDMPEE